MYTFSSLVTWTVKSIDCKNIMQNSSEPKFIIIHNPNLQQYSQMTNHARIHNHTKEPHILSVSKRQDGRLLSVAIFSPFVAKDEEMFS